MISSIEEILSTLPYPELVPFIAIISAIVVLLLARITRCSVFATFFSAGFFIVLLWLITFNLEVLYSEGQLGISFTGLAKISLITLLPVLLILLLMVYNKNAEANRKNDAALLLLISFLGGMATLSSTNWMMFFVGIQCLSLPIFGLLAFDTDKKPHVTTAVHYLVLSSIAIAMMLFGMALIYAQSGSLSFKIQAHQFSTLDNASFGLIGLGLALIFCGVSFKLSLVPFHFWAPKVYQNASFFVVGYLLVVVKTVIVFFVIANSWLIFAPSFRFLVTVLSALALFSMWLGSALMLGEKNLLRFIAFLSIGHLGFLLVPILSNHELAFVAIIADLIAFGIAILMVLGIQKTSFDNKPYETLAELKGLSYQSQSTALFLAIALASLAGIPLTAGFIAKYAIFMTGALSEQWGLLINMVLASVVSIFALLRLIISLFRKPDSSHQVVTKTAPITRGLLFIGALLLLSFGIAPQSWLAWIQSGTANAGYEDTISMKRE